MDCDKVKQSQAVEQVNRSRTTEGDVFAIFLYHQVEKRAKIMAGWEIFCPFEIWKEDLSWKYLGRKGRNKGEVHFQRPGGDERKE